MPSSFTEVVKPFSDRILWLPVYNIEVSILSMGATDATLPGSASPFFGTRSTIRTSVRR